MFRPSKNGEQAGLLSNETTPFLGSTDVEAGTSTAIFASPGEEKLLRKSKIERDHLEATQPSAVSQSTMSTAMLHSATHTDSSVPEPVGSLVTENTQPPSHNCPGVNCKDCEALQRQIKELEELQRLEVFDAPLTTEKSNFETPVQLLIRPDEHDVAQEAQRHTRRCQRHNRFRRRRRSKFRLDSQHRHDEDRKFLDLVEEFKDQKLETECVCELTKWTRFQECWYEVRRIIHIIWRVIWTLCPPLPNCCLNKIMFWPPQREYFFFESDEPVKKGTAGAEAEAAQRAKLKIRKGKTEFARGQIYRFGFEHQCAAEIENVECFFLQTEKNNQIACVFIKSPYMNARYTIIYAHPNASDISDHLSGCPSLHDASRFLNCDIISFDYSGYGISSGRPTEANVYADSMAVFNHLVDKRNIPIENIVLWGYSIGTAAMIDLALKFPSVAGVILLASPTSIVRTLYWNRGCCCRGRRNPCERPNDCCCDRFKSIKKIALVYPPTLFIHGIGDLMVPVTHSQALFKRAPCAVAPLFVPKLGHNNLENSRHVWNRMRVFIRSEARPPKFSPEPEEGVRRSTGSKKLKKIGSMSPTSGMASSQGSNMSTPLLSPSAYSSTKCSSTENPFID